MEAYILQNMWSKLESTQIRNGFATLRLDPSCFSEVFIALSSDGQRCLILRLESPFQFQTIRREKLEIQFNKDVSGLVLTLADNLYQDLFDDLVLSLFNVIKDISIPEDYIATFISTFRKWATFFDKEYVSRLDDDTVKGLIGELRLLSELVDQSDEIEVNETLRFWRGPYDESQDFVCIDRNIEVKTVSPRSTSFWVSSLDQLEEEQGKNLELLVYTAEQNFELGITLDHIFQTVKQMALSKGADVSILLEAISQKGLNPGNIAEYDGVRLHFLKEDWFNVLAEEFPRLTPDTVRAGITRANYKISIDSLESYLIRTKEL